MLSHLLNAVFSYRIHKLRIRPGLFQTRQYRCCRLFFGSRPRRTRNLPAGQSVGKLTIPSLERTDCGHDFVRLSDFTKIHGHRVAAMMYPIHSANARTIVAIASTNRFCRRRIESNLIAAATFDRC